MRIDWTNVGKRYAKTPARRKLIADCLESITWQAVPPVNMSFSGGMGLQAAIKEFHIPGVSHVADYNDFSVRGVLDVGLLGVQAHYKADGRVDIIFVEEGTGLCPLCAVVHAKGGSSCANS